MHEADRGTYTYLRQQSGPARLPGVLLDYG
jgi:hypothetical protein